MTRLRNITHSLPESAAAVTPNDSTDLAFDSTLFVGGGGNVKMNTVSGSTVSFTGVVAGTILPVKVRRVWSTGTTATNMTAMY